MGLFDFMKKKPDSQKLPFYQTGLELNTGDWMTVFSACLGRVMATQQACSDYVVKGQNWNVDFAKGIIAFGSDEYPLQFIGSESSSSNTWLWGWENVNGFSNELLTLANEAKGLGEQWQLAPFMVPGCNLTDEHNGHMFSIVTCGLSSQNLCYYRGPHAGGAIFVAFPVEDGRVFAPVDSQTFLNIVNNCILQYSLQQKVFVESFLLQNHTPYEWRDNILVAHFATDLYVTFEQVGTGWRIENISGVLH